ncbi:hypothetical protein J4L45_000114 [Salmonella enterica subsp. enterica serovar Newport]|nr:hypothetical protein [Salmonella enterica subsp. enterica serovar Newport]EHG5855220.1 hypothetical protein [Salmonella enterica subsp. enterica serovar Newport]
MDMKDGLKPIRRRRLKEWFADGKYPEKDSSYISQVINGKSIGEKAARRLERDYGMPEGYLDEPFSDSQGETKAAELLRFDFRQLKLLELADELPDSDVDEIIKQMEEKKRFYDGRFREYLVKQGIDPAKVEIKKLVELLLSE